jgi:hypothetical protein
MAIPRQYPHTTAVPMPSDDDVRRVVGDSYDPDSALNVTKMFAGTEDLFPALIGMVEAVFSTPDIDAKHREMIVLRSASVLNVRPHLPGDRRAPPRRHPQRPDAGRPP